jgi:hypothetical protein
LTAHHTSPVPPGSKDRTTARSISFPHEDPRPCVASWLAICAAVIFGIPPARLEPEPTATNSFDPSMDDATSRVQ